MTEPLPLIIIAIAAVALLVVFIPRLAGLWYARSAWTIEGADLAAKFKGLLLFGKNGSYLALSPKGDLDSVSFTKHSNEQGETLFQLRISSERLDPDRIREIETKLDAQPSRIQRSSTRRTDAGGIEIDITGLVVSDPVAMEGVATGVLATLGYGSSQKYKVSFEGPTDDSAVAEYYSQS